MTGVNNGDKGDMITRSACRVCGGKGLHKFLSLGSMPLANSFLKEDKLGSHEKAYPLDVYFCDKCHLVQLLDVVSPKVMFSNYLYMTSYSKPMQDHFREIADDVISRFKLGNNSLVVDIGSNDGTLLGFFSKSGPRILGIEPASNVAKAAEKRGIRTVNDFFCEKIAAKVAEDYGQADVILATNVFAHVDDLDGFVAGIKRLLSRNGIFIIEVPYLANMLANKEFDTVYHEHLSYFSLHPLVYLFSKFGMSVIDVVKDPVHGGSIRVFVRNAGKPGRNVEYMLSSEERAGMHMLEKYSKFAEDVMLLRKNLLNLLAGLKKRGARITGYGASAKGNTLLNYCKIGTEMLEYVTDTTPLKQGSFTPGMHIPVVSEDKFRQNPPDYALLLAWNYADRILKKEAEFRKGGGKFILPIPSPRII